MMNGYSLAKVQFMIKSIALHCYPNHRKNKNRLKTNVFRRLNNYIVLLLSDKK